MRAGKMKAGTTLLLAACLTTSVNAATVVSVGDGDTIRVSEGNKKITVRLACIDAPERSQQPWGSKSTERLKQLTPIGSQVTLRVQTTDRYGRVVAELINHQGNVNKLMVRAGQAFAYRRYLRKCDAQKYLRLEDEAKRQGIGIWSVGRSGITRPWDFRKEGGSSTTKSSGIRKYRCKEIGSWKRAQQLLSQGHSYLDRDRDGEACEGLRQPITNN